MEDFAHHPTAIKTTLAGLRETFADKRLVAVYEPRSNTARRSYYQDEYLDCFLGADVVVIKEVDDPGSYSATDSEIVALDVEQIVETLNQEGIGALSFPTEAQIQEFLLEELREGDLVVLMSNGSFGGLPQTLADALAKKPAG